MSDNKNRSQIFLHHILLSMHELYFYKFLIVFIFLIMSVYSSEEKVECPSFADAYKKSLQLIRERGEHNNVVPTTGRMTRRHAGEEMIVGYELQGQENRDNAFKLRLDFDPTKGPHFNVEVGNSRGRNTVRTKYALTFPGSEDDLIQMQKKLTQLYNIFPEEPVMVIKEALTDGLTGWFQIARNHTIKRHKLRIGNDHSEDIIKSPVIEINEDMRKAFEDSIDNYAEGDSPENPPGSDAYSMHDDRGVIPDLHEEIQEDQDD